MTRAVLNCASLPDPRRPKGGLCSDENKPMESCSTPVPDASSKGRSQTVETSLAIMRDLQALSARDLSVNMVEFKPDRVRHAHALASCLAFRAIMSVRDGPLLSSRWKNTRQVGPVMRDRAGCSFRLDLTQLHVYLRPQGQEDAGVLQHQQTYCRYALSNSSKPSNSWRAHTRLHENAFPPAEQSFRHITAQQCPKLPSPFQAMTDSDVSPESLCSNYVALNEPPSASLALDLCTHSLTTSLNDSTGVQYPETSLLSSTVSREHYWNQQPSSISKHASTPVFPTPQDLNSLRLDSAPSFASDTLSFQTSPSLSLPEQPCASAASCSAIKLVNDSSTVLMEIRLEIISAPAMFAQPIGINKAISPPFQVLSSTPVKCKHLHIMKSVL